MNPGRTGTFRTLAALAAAGSVVSCGRQHKPQQYNIVFIMTDDHTAQMMSCYDRRNIETPNLDRIAADGVRFTNAFVANSLSGPSRACILTGKHSCANHFYDNSSCVFDFSQTTFPKLLQQAGYQTAMVGKLHLEANPEGFDYWEILPGQGDYYNPEFIRMDGTRVRDTGYVTNIITDKSLEWLEHGRDRNRPFCIMIHHKAVHRDWLPELKYLNEYEDRVFELPETFYDDYEGRIAAAAQEMSIDKDMDIVYDTKMAYPGASTRLSGLYEAFTGRLDPADRKVYDDFYRGLTEDFMSRNLEGRELAEFKFQRYMRDYAKVVKTLDDNVGRVLDYLRDAGLEDNTLVVYTSDQGFYMGEHGWFDKRFMYEESMRTPLVMRLPKGFSRRGDIDRLVQNIDFAPTFLELAGAEVPDEMQGVSLMPLLRGENPQDWRKSLYYHFYEYPAEHMVMRHFGIRTERYKLIHFYNSGDFYELYDLQNDPSELDNLYGKEGYEDLADSLKNELSLLQEQYDDPVRLGYDKARADGK
ncbi:MAG: sulfatase [Bacteroidales bacterium]|nr:sulfatase [Bacteroidales bacterium]